MQKSKKNGLITIIRKWNEKLRILHKESNKVNDWKVAYELKVDVVTRFKKAKTIAEAKNSLETFYSKVKTENVAFKKQ